MGIPSANTDHQVLVYHQSIIVCLFWCIASIACMTTHKYVQVLKSDGAVFVSSDQISSLKPDLNPSGLYALPDLIWSSTWLAHLMELICEIVLLKHLYLIHESKELDRFRQFRDIDQIKAAKGRFITGVLCILYAFVCCVSPLYLILLCLFFSFSKYLCDVCVFFNSVPIILITLVSY